MQDNSVFTFILLSLATWRISNLLIHEDGPLDVFARLRFLVGVKYDEKSNTYGTNFVSILFSCIYCMSIWVGIIVTGLFYGFTSVLHFMIPFALSAVSILIKEIVDGK